MEQDPSQLIQKFLTNDGWKFQVREDQSVILGFQGEKAETQIPIIVRVTEHWVSLTAYMLLGAPDDQLYRTAAVRISEWNYITKIAKFAFSPDRSLILGAEIPLQCLSVELFQKTLDMLCYYSDYAYPHLVTLWQSVQGDK